jgi:quinoprotein glucose dehydrogenase
MLAPWEVLDGGDSSQGKRSSTNARKQLVFAVTRQRWGEVGPDLSGIGSRKDRPYLLESILFPNRQIAQGFETLVITTKSGTTYSGTLKSERPDELVLATL